MGRNKYSAGEIKEIGKLLRLKNAGNRLQQKLIRHDLRVDYEEKQKDAIASGEQTDWQEAMKQWNEWESSKEK